MPMMATNETEQWSSQSSGDSPPITDRNVEEIRRSLLERSQRGIAKYGVTTCRNPLEVRQWLQHLQEELLDAAVYIEALKTELTRTEEGRNGSEPQRTGR